jgi:hypothetical protein
VVDILQVLEGATYAAFIVGAIIAVYELRSVAKDRRADMLMRLNEFWCSKDFEEMFLKIREAYEEKIQGAREYEDRVGKLAMWTLADYLDGLAALARTKVIDKETLFVTLSFYRMWLGLEPWIRDKRKNGYPQFCDNFEWLAMKEKRLNEREQKTKET